FVLRARRRLLEDQLLGRAPTEQHRELVPQLRAGDEVLVLLGQREGPAQRATPRDDRHLVDWVGVRQRVADERMSALVVRDHTLLLVGDDARALLGAGDDTVDRLLELWHADLLEAAARGEARGFVHEG